MDQMGLFASWFFMAWGLLKWDLFVHGSQLYLRHKEPARRKSFCVPKPTPPGNCPQGRVEKPGCRVRRSQTMREPGEARRAHSVRTREKKPVRQEERRSLTWIWKWLIVSFYLVFLWHKQNSKVVMTLTELSQSKHKQDYKLSGLQRISWQLSFTNSKDIDSCLQTTNFPIKSWREDKHFFKILSLLQNITLLSHMLRGLLQTQAAAMWPHLLSGLHREISQPQADGRVSRVQTGNERSHRVNKGCLRQWYISSFN